jgi:uncharacterized protein YdbL (DUF1318 family)
MIGLVSFATTASSQRSFAVSSSPNRNTLPSTKSWIAAVLIGLVVSACVTINVYFPEAEAEEAAGEFIDKVIGTDPAPPPGDASTSWRIEFDLSPIGTAHAAADLSIETPAVKAIQQRMAARFAASLEKHFDDGALGLTADGMVELRDASRLPLPERASMKQVVADENRDRAAVYREIAVANGHPEWEAEIRSTFAAQWIGKARKGWYYQDGKGAWVQK